MSFVNKIISEVELKIIRKNFKKKKIVLCHGVFDLLHVGHLNYFRSAKKLGDLLVVSITGDQFVNKGPGRPAFSINNRVKFLNELNCIDFICESKNFTSERIIKNLRPNFYCKGEDYSEVKKIKKDLNLKKELTALKSVNGVFKIIREDSFSSSEFINNNQLQNLDEECKTYITNLRKKINLQSVLKSVERLKKKKVLIIGETIIDNYITTEAIGKSGKEPVMVVKKKKQIKFLGGVGYIANICSNFAKEVKLISFLGDHETEKNFIKKNLDKRIKNKFLIKKNSPTIIKTRFLDDYRKTKLLGVYNINDEIISKKEEKSFYENINKNIQNYDIVIVADYGHGIISDKIRDILKKNSKKLFLNTQINSFNRGYHTVFKYKKINSLIINESELRYELRDKESMVIDLAKQIRKKIIVNYIIITQGKFGSVMINCDNWSISNCPAFSQNNIDTVGAGDTFFSLSSMSIASKIDNNLNLLISSLAASHSTNQVGNLSIFNERILNKQLTHMFK